MEKVDLTATPEQAAIVADRGRDMLVTAGAGSGKTRVLVERYLSLLAAHGIPEIAAITFTDAAAAEMRDRVRREVQTRLELAQHRADLDSAVIGTIHSLCLQVLREHPVEAAIDPAARVLSDIEMETERRAACQEALEAAAEAGGESVPALQEIGIYEVERRLPLMVERRDEVENAFSAMNGETAQEWAAHVRATLDGFVNAAIDAARPFLEQQLEWIRDARLGENEDRLATYVDGFMQSLGEPSEGEPEDLARRLNLARQIDGPRTFGSARHWTPSPKAVRDVIRGIKDFAAEVNKIAWTEDDEPAALALWSLRLLFQDACARYQLRKQELAALDYLDLELMAIRLLRENPDVARDYRARFRHVMVDEIQDTNPVQIAFIDLLTRDPNADDAGSPPQRFFVGDIKQAIYHFRGSDVRYVNRLRRQVQDDGGVVLELSRSFRAHDDLVETLNDLFSRVFGDAREDYEAPMAEMTGRGSGAPRTPHMIVMPIMNAWRDPDGKARLRAADVTRMEADTVAREIALLLAEPAQVADRETGGTRAVRPADVAMLFRRFSKVDVFERALENYGVPYRTHAGDGFFERQEVLDLINMVQWLAQPAHDIALFGVLRSPFFAIDDQSLLAIRQDRRGMMDALRDPPDGVLAAAVPFCRHAADVLTGLSEDARTASPETLVERALARTDFEASWAPLQGGDQALVNIRQFVALARASKGESLDAFAANMAVLRDDSTARVAEAALDDSDAVRLLTIHAAKGLEFPVVFIPDAHGTRPNSGGGAISWRAEDGLSTTLAPRIMDGESNRRKPGFLAYLEMLDAREEAAEYKRLFYVAATRAADVLYVSGRVSNTQDGGGANPDWLTWASAHVVGDGVEVRAAIPVDLESIARRPPIRLVAPPDAEQDFVPPLVTRLPIIPLRSSTPVTALNPPWEQHESGGHGDGLGLIRGSLAHKSIENRFKRGGHGGRPGLPALREAARALDGGLDEAAVQQVAQDVDEMLARFDTNPLAETLRDPATRAYFELPFLWDWDGVAIHGTIDLAYQVAGNWYVIDFKTDWVDGDNFAQAAAPYLSQLGLYSAALERATGQRPQAGLLFLRTGTLHALTDDEMQDAMSVARGRIDAGSLTHSEAARDIMAADLQE